MNNYTAVMVDRDVAALCIGKPEWEGTGCFISWYTHEEFHNCDVIATIIIDDKEDEIEYTLNKFKTPKHYEVLQIETCVQSRTIKAENDQEAIEKFFNRVSSGKDCWWAD